LALFLAFSFSFSTQMDSSQAASAQLFWPAGQNKGDPKGAD